ncbi:MAG: acyl-CoA thioesterase [Thermoplasmata archaeon]|uniref:Acyl-CoA thioesterase n=1 Tax=Candidatus Sysuiplasma superficiale TaxID=2823368 RepID=A0A8J7YRR2_9ARCH|nr:acyl-CoA thioesterase [Candidatus Sysuiplasma superficiale]MBX8643424.1 acyl-CoA thioesterase [Candidatus Sysuiplasma superficiale]
MPHFIHRFPVNWVDTDGLAVVHFSNYLRYFEKTEEEFYRSAGGESSLMRERGIAFPRVEVKCTYTYPCRYGDIVQTEIWLDRLTDRSVRINFIVKNVSEDRVSAEGYAVLVCVETAGWKAAVIPDEVREIFEKLR